MIEVKFEKGSILKGNGETTVLFKISPNVKIDKKNKSKLNIGFAIDVSGSMSGYVNKPQPFDGIINRNLIAKQLTNSEKTKLQQAIEATIKALDIMDNGDVFSLTIFESSVQTVIPNVVISKDNREEIKSRINKLIPLSSTDLHGGWVASATQVAQKLNKESLNRVILLTDGQTNLGITNTDLICSDVNKLCSAGVSTTTFGFGHDFNEDLLVKMSESGDGNSYYIDDDGKIIEMFEAEFSEISNLIGKSVKIKINSNFESSNINNLPKNSSDEYLLANLINNKRQFVLFNIKYESAQEGTLKLGEVVLSWTDKDGNEMQIKEEIIASVVSQEKFDELLVDDEVNTQKTLMLISNLKEEAGKYMANGNMHSAKDLLGQAFNYSSLCNSDLVKSETQNLKDMVDNFEAKDAEVLKKSLIYQSYATKRSK